MLHRLQDRAIVAITGPEARSFLQGLVTNDVNRLAPGKPLYTALLTPQGKVLFDFLLVDDGQGTILIDGWAPARDALIKRLTMYRLRAKLEIAPRDDLGVFAAWDGAALPGIAFGDPRLSALGHRSIGLTAEGGDGYLGHRLALGVPEAADFGSDKTFALDGGLDELHAIAFDKGCYVGQELTARMKHRGTARKRILPIETMDKSTLTAGVALQANNHALGEVVSAYDNRGFALIRLDRLEEAGEARIDAAGHGIHVTKPDWLSA
jgi:folate-binding protein YgfZ